MNQKLKSFSQLGFSQQDETTNEILGKCPFCGKDKHFSINKEKLKWHCFKCGEEGGYKDFIIKITQYGKENFKGDAAIKLSKERSLPIKVLRKFDVGYLPNKNVYILPTGGALRLYNFKSFVHLSGATVELFNSEQILDKKGVIWLCEGEWDTIALSDLNIPANDIAIGVPGAGTFKVQWLELFRDRIVNVLYDNDDAGRKGSIKIYNSLKTVVRELNFVHWGEDLKEGYDIRDFYINKCTLVQLKKLLQDKPQGVEGVVVTVKEDKFDGEGLMPEEVYKRYRKWLYLPNSDIFDALFGTVIANRLEGDPLWMFLVGVPGSAKTELLMSLSDAPKTFSVSALQPHMLVSGYRAGGTDPSLILKLDQKVLLIKDFTTVLNMNQQTREETFGVLRDIYDGEHIRFFGNNAGGIYKSKFGLIAAVTHAIEQYTELDATLGPRFFKCFVPIEGDVDLYSRKAISNVNKEKKMREELRDIGTATLNYNFNKIPIVSDKYIDKILAIAKWIAMLRGTVVRDRYSKDVLYKPYIELPTRLSKQFYKLLLGICMFKRVKDVGISEYKTLKYIARSTVPTSLELVMKGIYKNDPERKYTTKEIVDMIGLPRITSMRYTENLVLLGMLKKEQMLAQMDYYWQFTEEGFDVIERSGVYA